MVRGRTKVYKNLEKTQFLVCEDKATLYLAHLFPLSLSFSLNTIHVDVAVQHSSMSEKTSVDQYGRKTWNLKEYEKDAKRKRPSDTEESAANAAKLVKNMTVLQQRQKLFKESFLAVKSHTLLGADAASSQASYGKNKRFGFFCPICDLSFRDTLALVDHINLPQHQKKVVRLGGDQSGQGESLVDGVKRATLEQVAQTIEELVKKLLQKKLLSGAAENLQEKVRKREEFEAERFRLRDEKKQQKKTEEAEEPSEMSEMGKLMGIEGFGSTKK